MSKLSALLEELHAQCLITSERSSLLAPLGCLRHHQFVF